MGNKTAVREVIPQDPRFSARWHQHDYPGPYARWNYHPEFEVHLICAGTGRYIVGDGVGVFGPGQLVLVGPNLPHDWISDLSSGESIVGRDVVFQFHSDWLRQCEDVLPELGELNALWQRSARGIEFSGSAADRGAAALKHIGATSGPDRLRHIFALFHILNDAPAGQQRTLAGEQLEPLDDPETSVLINEALKYIFENLTGTVRLSTAAAITGMSESGFSRFFRRASGQSFSQMVRKLRLSHACKLLQQTSVPISQIAHDVGYSNLSNFNRQFLGEYGMPPSRYRAESEIIIEH